ncbi:cordon-bleu protein-like 1 isoform X2 [Pseudophryne corroboree]|uniref:cordon-bleu protein-like 1 isoform X2 n=1 Tax=Pseudophryne corroboree TaxID=495146 RepID=UPI003081E20F
MKGKVWKLLCWRKKAKGKAPLPPGEARYSDSLPSFDSADTVQYNMDQKENIIDRDIELKVVLPGDRLTSTIVNGSKPMMDLLVFLCAQYHLNPSTYTIDLIAADNSQLKFKPNTPIGMLEVESVVLKSKNLDDKTRKPGPTVPEQTVRLVINYKRTQKTVMRVSPFISLQDLIRSISSKCEFDPRTTVLLHDYESQKPLDITKSLNDLGLRELYAMDHSKAASPTEFRPPPLQESYQNMEVKHNEDKRFFNFFRRSTKKKRDQTNSAPATPLLNKPRPSNIVRTNTVSKSYDSNTMPSDVPKKRRAPLPPMYPPHNAANDTTHGQIRTSSCVVKSVSVDETERTLPGYNRCRTGSFQHSMTSSYDSSLRRTKRKAPLPPSPPPKTLQDSNQENDETKHLKTSNDEKSNHVTSPAVDVISEPELQEIEKKEELNFRPKDEASSTSKEDKNNSTKEETSGSIKEEKSDFAKEETSGSTKEETSLSSAEERSDAHTVAVDTVVTSETQTCSVLSNAVNTVMISEDEIAHSTQEHFLKDETVPESTTLDYDKDGESEISTTTTGPANHEIFESKAVVTEQTSQALPCEQPNETTNLVFQKNSHISQTETEVNLKLASMEKGKTQDSAVQTVNFDTDVEITAEKELENYQGNSYSTSVSSTSSLQHELNGHTSQQIQVYEQKTLATGIEQNKLEFVDSLREDVHTQTVQENIVEGPQSKTFQLYRQHSDPRPKPSNELTRDYLPKIGMTTYKIVPQRLYDVERCVESESSQDAQSSIYSSVSEQYKSHTVTDSNNTSSLGPIGEKSELSTVVKNGNHSPQGASVIPVSTISKNIADPSRKVHLALARSSSSAPILKTDNTTIPEIKTKTNPISPVKGPSSFYLQMQRRASSMYVTSAIAKSKPSTVATNSTVKLKDLGNEASQITIKTLPSRYNVLNLSSSLEEKKQEDSSMLAERPREIKNGEIIAEPGNISSVRSYVERESKQSKVTNEVPPSKVSVEYKKHVSFEENKQNVDHVPSMEGKLFEATNMLSNVSSAETRSQVRQHEYQTETVSTAPSKPVRPVSSPTGQSAPLSLQKLRTFATPRPFLGANPTSFTPAVTSAVKRSQSFTSGTSPIKQPLNVDAPIGWSPVTSPSESKNSYPLFTVRSQEQTENQTLTPELKYRVHSPPPVPEKKTTISFQSSDPEQLRQSIMAAIRSGEAAANLKRITIRSNTIAINGRPRIGHPVFSESLPEI